MAILILLWLNQPHIISPYYNESQDCVNLSTEFNFHELGIQLTSLPSSSNLLHLCFDCFPAPSPTLTHSGGLRDHSALHLFYTHNTIDLA